MECDIGIKDGVIICLAKDLPVRERCEVIDAEGAYVTVSLNKRVPADELNSCCSLEGSTRMYT